jgi:Lar family restriction alleviation protein
MFPLTIAIAVPVLACLGGAGVLWMLAGRPRAGGGPSPGPCPFCGASNSLLVSSKDGDCYSLSCYGCRARGPGERTAQEAFAAWNRRRAV